MLYAPAISRARWRIAASKGRSAFLFDDFLDLSDINVPDCSPMNREHDRSPGGPRENMMRAAHAIEKPAVRLQQPPDVRVAPIARHRRTCSVYPTLYAPIGKRPSH